MVQKAQHLAPQLSIPRNHDLADSIAFAYRNSTASCSEKTALSLEGSPDQQEGDSERYVVIEEGSGKRLDSKKRAVNSMCSSRRRETFAKTTKA